MNINVEPFSKKVEQNGFYISWSKEGYGFGELTIFIQEDGKLFIDSECMGEDFVKEVFNEVINSAEIN